MAAVGGAVQVNLLLFWTCWSSFAMVLTLQAPTPQNGQTHAQTICRLLADELFECVWPFCRVGALKDKSIIN